MEGRNHGPVDRRPTARRPVRQTSQRADGDAGSRAQPGRNLGAWREARSAGFTESTGLGMDRLTPAGKARAVEVRDGTGS